MKCNTRQKLVKNFITGKFQKFIHPYIVYLLKQSENFPVFDSILDCCSPKNVGSNEYKGNYMFQKALAGSNNSRTCKYGGSTTLSSNAVINCEPNMETGPTYGILNVTSCPAKYQTTNNLEKFNKVELCYFVSEKNTNIIWWKHKKYPILSQRVIWRSDAL